MGKALLIIVLGFSTIFGTITLNLNRHSLETVENYSDHFRNTIARNCATSGVYMALSKLYQNNAWRTGFQDLTLAQGNFSVQLEDFNDDPNLSIMELRILSTASFENATKSIEVLVGIPPDLEDLAVFCTDTIDNVTIKDESGNGNNGALVGDAAVVKDGKFGSAISVSGTGYVDCGNSEILNQEFEGITMELWARAEGFVDIQALAVKWAFAAGTDHIGLFLNGDKALIAVADGIVGENGLTGTKALSKNSWIHIAGTWNAGDVMAATGPCLVDGFQP